MKPLSIRAVLFAISLVGFLSLAPFAEAKQVYIKVGQAKARKTIVAFPPIKYYGPDADRGGVLRKIQKTIQTDLNFMGLFRFLPPSAFIEDTKKAGLTRDFFKFSDWTSIGAEFLIKAALRNSKGKITLEAYLHDTYGGKTLIAKRYLGKGTDAAVIGHTFANDVVTTLTGLPGIFLTKIAMSCKYRGKKEIVVTDFDGSSAKRITNHRSIAFAPAWSPDGTRIAYSLYTRHRGNIKNIDLYEYNFNNNRIRLLSSRKGINSGADYSPDGKKIALTMSFLGNPEIFSLDVRSKKVTRLTKTFGFDVDPSWGPRGQQLAFSSSRSGKPMIHSMPAGGEVGTGVRPKRLTIAGRYNATPDWSPQNNKMAFAGWNGNKAKGRFDIFIMNPNGTNIERLTKNQGNNEDPSFSPDGQFIVFSSNRTGKKHIYVMNIDGSFVRNLTLGTGLGDCVTPKWSNPPIRPTHAENI